MTLIVIVDINALGIDFYTSFADIDSLIIVILLEMFYKILYFGSIYD
jgi:hypothetical protein